MKLLNRTKKIDSTEKIREELKSKVDIVKEVRIQFDGKQFLVKIPAEISKFYGIKKGNKLRFIIRPVKKGEGENDFIVVK